MCRVFTFATMFTSICLFVAQSQSSAAEPAQKDTNKTAPRADAVKLIDDALKAVDKNPDQAASALETAAKQVLALVPKNALLQNILQGDSTVDSSTRESESKAADLRRTLAEASQILRFEPTIEADAPAGFPQPTPVGEIEVKRYPAYRLARTEIARDGSDESAFFTLFRHITSNQIAMTAPVEMTYQLGKDNDLRPQAMAFLYESPRIGQVRELAEVSVADIPKMTVVSIGMRGDHSQKQVVEARDLLERWLTARRDRFLKAGPLRVMGYNSPMVPAAKRYFEVQIPVEEKEPDKMQ